MSSKKSKKSLTPSKKKLMRRRLVAVLIGVHGVTGRYEEVHYDPKTKRTETSLRYGNDVGFVPKPELLTVARAAAILMGELNAAVLNEDTRNGIHEV